MRNNLSSKIALTHIPERYYKPTNAYEQSLLTRYEKIPTQIFPAAGDAAEVIAKAIVKELKQAQSKSKSYVLAVSGGDTPSNVFELLVKYHKEEGISLSNLHIFPLYEFYPLTDVHQGVSARIREEFVAHVDMPDSNLHAIDTFSVSESTEKESRRYEQEIADLGGIDLVILGIGREGTIALNMPGAMSTSITRLVTLDKTSREEAMTTFNALDAVPQTAITAGLSVIFKAKKIYLLALGEDKAKMIKETVEGDCSVLLPASQLQMIPQAKVLVDLQAASQLTRISHPWLVTSCDWDDKLIRRAIVWLCDLTGKPILKLTNKDYAEHGLNELITKFGSAYNVNIKIFNDIQHTITGWPGGKPNADDSNRPERATPYPKRVIVFSPHPDDDVISMGGTFRRLVVQGHDVHVAYQTSGNIAVGDEEVIRYVSYLRNVCEHLGQEDSPVMKRALDIRNYLLNEKKEGSIETPEVRFMKGTIRREEARTACRFVGIEQDDHVHFLDLPFYETGAIKKGDLTQADVDIIKELICNVKPHQMFVAGDLADPHGTHKVCLDAILAAIDQVKHEEWYQECKVWMYRGAWAEWEIDHIEMAVPMSPEEVRFKRNSILKHQSQMESAPFLGNDERLFWQRAEERNRATADLYSRLGLASYEAIEAFVEYHPVD